MTNETRERDGFGGDAEAAESAGSERRGAGGAETFDRAPVGTATATGATAGPSATARAEREEAEATDDRLAERLRAVERAITGTDDAVADLGDEAAAAAEREALSERLDDLESRVTELEAATQAIRGYVGSVRSVNQKVERRADLALAEARKNGGDAGDGRAADSEASDGTVPDEDALDAALPANRSGEGAASATPASTPATENAGADEAAGDSWRPAALERLRESF